MSKRAPGLARRPMDAYDTPLAAVVPLLAQLLPGTRFIEPCWGRGDLAGHLMGNGHDCVMAFDVEPRVREGITLNPRDGVRTFDATTFQYAGRPGFMGASAFITNPPWTRTILHAIIDNLAAQLPTWLLFDADWASNVHSASRLDFCDRIVPIGRVKWIEGSANTGKDNAAWYRFDKTHTGGPRWINWRNR